MPERVPQQPPDVNVYGMPRGKPSDKPEPRANDKLWSFYLPLPLETHIKVKWPGRVNFDPQQKLEFQSCGTGHQNPVTMGHRFQGR